MQTVPNTPNEVSLKEVVGEWHVSVRERGREPWTRVFYDQTAAVIFAHGQKARLGLHNVRIHVTRPA